MGQYIQKIFSGTSNRELTAKIAEQANLGVGDIVIERFSDGEMWVKYNDCLLYTSPSPRDMRRSRMPSSA